MPGKINPVIAKAATMAVVPGIGNDVTVTVGRQSGAFELNVMLSRIAHNVLLSERLLGNAARVLADRAIAGCRVNREHVAALVKRNPS